jgi:hypothetical protein
MMDIRCLSHFSELGMHFTINMISMWLQLQVTVTMMQMHLAMPHGIQ